MIKKEYMTPSVKVVKLKHKCQILAGSNPYGINDTLQDDEYDEVDEGW